jgi:DNA (cytosine-5)-methyltransferase 1
VRLLDLFCGAGGAAMGYHRAGFEVVGVDIKPQPRYPFEFHQADAMTYPLEGFDAIHASPPCQGYSVTKNFTGRTDYPDLLAAIRDRLATSGMAWVIENVPGAPMRPDYKLCGCMFGLKRLRRVRWFETSWNGLRLVAPHRHQPDVITVAGHDVPSHQRKFGRSVTLDERKAAMGIDWMGRDELGQAIPPAYTEYIGRELLQTLCRRCNSKKGTR